MNIVVCVKWVVSTDSVIKAESGIIKDRGLYHTVNPYDLVAVEEALRLKELHNKGEVILVSMSPPSAEKGLRRCLALGADKGIILWDTAFESSDNYATALTLAAAIRGLSYDLVLCGQQAADVAEGQVGAILAELLNIPLVTAATKIDIAPDSDKVIVQRKLERGNREVVETNLPALLTVETGLNKPRYPSLRAIYVAQRKELTEYNMEALKLNLEQVGVKGSKTKIVAQLPPRPKPKKLFTPDSSLPAAERMRLIMAGGVTKKDSNLLEGAPEEIASNIARFLSERKLLSQ